jgi:hypothetical protein
VARRAATGKRIQDDGVSVGRKLQNTLNEFNGLGGDKDIFCVRKNFHNFLLRILGVTDFLVGPNCARDNPFRNFRQKAFDCWHIMPGLAPPNAAIHVQFNKAFFGISPILAFGWRFDDSA